MITKTLNVIKCLSYGMVISVFESEILKGNLLLLMVQITIPTISHVTIAFLLFTELQGLL